MSAAPPHRRRREILGMSAVLVPFTSEGAIDWAALEA
ncbi:MAG TPA: dihydrodipicolinate synthase family protein, partial [Acidimicrobiaceae bacterium]|nr:dihydrodipicolinate synthase family protein [Acidimicrobiaceae bacterium]